MLLLGRGQSSVLLLASQSWEVTCKELYVVKNQAPLSRMAQGSEADSHH